GIIADVIDEEGFKTDPSAWLRPQNEHFVVVTRLLYAANVLLTGGHNLGLTLFTWLAAAAQAIILSMNLPGRDLSPTVDRLYFPLVAGVFIFTPLSWHNWILGMSGTAWISTNLFVVSAIASLTAAKTLRSAGWFRASLGFALVATLTYSTGLAVWPALIIGAFVLRLGPNRIGTLMLAGGFAILSYLFLYQRPSDHPALETDLFRVVEYLLTLLGSTLTGDAAVAPAAGAFGLLLSIFLAVRVLWSGSGDRRGVSIALSLQTYSVVNALLAAIARSGFGADQAFASRYASLPSLFWLGLFAAAALSLPPARKRTGTLLLSAIVIAILVHSYQRTDIAIGSALERERLKPLAAAAIVTENLDLPLLQASVSPRHVEAFFRRRDTIAGLEALGHVPYGGLFEGCPPPGSPLPVAPRSPGASQSTQWGALESARVKGQNVHYFGGHIGDRLPPPRCILLVNQAGIVRGIGVIAGGPPGWPAQRLTPPRESPDWAGYASIRREDEWIGAVALWDDSPDTWMRLGGLAIIARGQTGEISSLELVTPD
ncbi:MAG: hypothetical protein U9Q81_26820, partial [Pseudomonadota bacterium]|nr:hypothetical protein [Pseudomonadota bacterium]